MTTIVADFFHGFQTPTRSGSAGADRDWYTVEWPDTPIASGLQSRLTIELAQIAKECAEKGWDGYQAKPIDLETCNRVARFLSNLPTWMQVPDIVPESDGEIAIEWYRAACQTLSISIGPSGPVHYAGRFGHNQEVHGVEPFLDGVPSRLLVLISEFLSTAAN